MRDQTLRAARASRFSRLLLYLLLVLSPAVALADSIRISGVELQVDRLAVVDSQNVKLTFEGNSEIVSKPNLKNHLLKLAVNSSRSNQLLAAQDLKKIIENALVSKNYRRSWIALDALFKRDVDELIHFVGRLLKKKDAFELFKIFLAESPPASKQRKAFTLIVYEVGMHDLKWLRSNAIRSVYLVKEELGELLLSRFDLALQERELDQATQILAFRKEIFGGSDEEHRVLSKSITTVRKIIGIAESGGVERLFPFLEFEEMDPALVARIAPIVNGVLHHEATAALNNQQYSRALSLVSRVRLASRTPTTHKLAREALASLPERDRSILSDPLVSKALKVLSEDDPVLRKQYIKLLERIVTASIRNGRPFESQMSTLTYLRPDPSRGNDALRVSISSFYLANGMKQVALRHLSEIQTGMSLNDRISLFWQGYYGNFNLYLAMFIGIAAILIWVFVRTGLLSAILWALESLRSGGPEYSSASAGAGSGSASAAFKRRGGMGSLNPRYSEYERCLDSLGLSKGASVKEIKGAYRKAVKEVHPDKVGEESDNDDAFIELTKSYERALELRRELGLDESG